jgi:hypothetical protein
MTADCGWGVGVRNEKEAANDMQRIIRGGENVLANCEGKPAEEFLSFGNPETDRSYYYVTNARMIWMSANNDGILSIPWKYMTSVRQGKKRFKNTVGFSFRRPDWSSATDYPADYVSGAVANAVAKMMSNLASTYDLPVESAWAIKVPEPRDGSPLAEIARMYGLPEWGLKCSVCGKTAGYCKAESDELFPNCEGCERTFEGVR